MVSTLSVPSGAMQGAWLHNPPHSYLFAIGPANGIKFLVVCGYPGGIPFRIPSLPGICSGASPSRATQLTRYLQRALTVSEADAVAARARAGRCDTCLRAPRVYANNHQESFEVVSHPDEMLDSESADRQTLTGALEKDVSDVLAQLDTQEDIATEDNAEDALECGGSAALLAARVCRTSEGLRATLSRLLGAVPPPHAARALRERLAVLRDQNDALRARHAHDHQSTEDLLFPKAELDPTIQEHPSNGG